MLFQKQQLEMPHKHSKRLRYLLGNILAKVSLYTAFFWMNLLTAFHRLLLMR